MMLIRWMDEYNIYIYLGAADEYYCHVKHETDMDTTRHKHDMRHIFNHPLLLPSSSNFQQYCGSERARLVRKNYFVTCMCSPNFILLCTSLYCVYIYLFYYYCYLKPNLTYLCIHTLSLQFVYSTAYSIMCICVFITLSFIPSVSAFYKFKRFLLFLWLFMPCPSFDMLHCITACMTRLLGL